MQSVRTIRNYFELPVAAKAEFWKDRSGLSVQDPGVERAIGEAVGWLCRAQDSSLSKDGGVARHYSLVEGWGTSYPETTGYIVPTMLAYAQWRGDEEVRKRARRMLDWLVSIQFPEGGFQAGLIDSEPIVPSTFNTGQILLGLASGVREFGELYRNPMVRAAEWLVKTQDPDGCWRRYPTPFAEPGEKTYETHVAWGLLEAARVEPNRTYVDTALANMSWALRHQKANGWLDNCCLTDNSRPLTHTLGYALRGVEEAYRFTKDPTLLKAALRVADGLLTAIRDDGFLPGRLRPNWRGAVPWACLTGMAQIAHCWFMLYQDTSETRYRDAALAANRYVRRTINVDGPPEIRGAVKGSFPVYGDYGTYQYLSWASKFFVDSNMLEMDIRKKDAE